MKRIALAIGVGNYTNLEPLNAPPNDAHRIAEALGNARFDVTELHDNRAPIDDHEPACGKSAMVKAINAFLEDLSEHSGNCEAFFYFSGHSDVFRNQLCLEPSDWSKIYDGIPVEPVLTDMRTHATTAVAVVDACRSPYYSDKAGSNTENASFLRSWGHNSIRGGMFSPLVVCWACSPLEKAKAEPDGSVYTNALLEYICAPGVPFISAVSHANADVENMGMQKPVLEVFGRLDASWCLMGGEPANKALEELEKEKREFEECRRQIEAEKKHAEELSHIAESRSLEAEAKLRDVEAKLREVEERESKLREHEVGQAILQLQQASTSQPRLLEVQHGNKQEFMPLGANIPSRGFTLRPHMGMSQPAMRGRFPYGSAPK